MPRAAGSGPNYEFVLRDANNGRYRKDVSIALPSSTTIIKRILAAPQLIPWTYKATREGVSSAVIALRKRADSEEILDLLENEDEFGIWLKDNGMRPDDVRDASASRGTKAHGVLERLAGLDPDHAFDIAEDLTGSADPFERAIGSWWVVMSPLVVAAEMVLPCPQHGYCGTTDLVYYDDSDVGLQKVVLDLKTRRAGLYAYDSDHFQVDSNLTAYNLLNPGDPAKEGRILLAFDDGTFREERVTLEVGSFLRIKAVWDAIEAARVVDPAFGKGK